MTLHIFLIGSLITPLYLTVCGWHYTSFWKEASQCLVLWPTIGEWHYASLKGSFWVRESYTMTNRMWVILHINLEYSLITYWTTESGWHCTFYEMQSNHILSWPTESKWHHTPFWMAVSTDLVLWPTVCQWNCTFILMQSHHTLPYGQQFVSDTDAVLKVFLHLIYDQSLWVHCILSDNQPYYISECLEQEVSQTLLALSTYYLSIWISTANSE